MFMYRLIYVIYITLNNRMYIKMNTSSQNLEKKRKRIVLSIDEKIHIIKRLKDGETPASLSQEYNIGKSTISTIKSNEEKILEYHAETVVNSSDIKKKKVISTAKNNNLENAIHLWFLQQRAIGTPISGPILCEKALQLNSKMNGDPNFRASNGWLRNFKKRHGIRLLNTQSEKLSADVQSAENFKIYIQNLIAEENYSQDCIYNADESGLYWRSLPNKTLALKAETAAPNYERTSKDRVTLMFCSNASGSHKLPLFIVGKSEQPKCFNDVPDLPFVYKEQNNGWMDTKTFKEWYLLHFISSVKEYQKKTGQEKKVLLLLDNEPAHISKDVLSLSNDMFRIVLLPPNVTSILQPMDQNVIEKVKKFYRKILLKCTLVLDKDEENTVSFVKNLKLKDCCHIISEAWNDMSMDDLSNAWKQLLSNEKLKNMNSTLNSHEAEILELHEIVQRIPHCANCDIEDTTWWIQSDKYDSGFQIFDDNDIISEITGQKSSEKISSGGNADEKRNEDNEGVSNADALKSVNNVIKWLEGQPESNIINLQYLNVIKEFIIMKSSIKCE